MILVTAATGRIGTHVVRALVAAGEATRVVTRDPTKLAIAGVEAVRGDLDRADTLDDAFRGVTKLLLISPGPDVPTQDARLIAAARRAGVTHLVMLSSLGVELGGIASGQLHAPGEQLLRESGLPWTILRPSEFMTNTLWWAATIQATGSIFVPTASGKTGFIAPSDIAAVASYVLTSDGHDGKVYRLTGPTAITIQQIASVIAEIAGRPVHHVDVSEEAFRDGAKQSGMPPFAIEMLVVYYRAVREGRLDLVTSDVSMLLGRPARSFAEWAADNVDAFRQSPQRATATT